MPYLSYREYNECGFVEIEQSEFNRLVSKAGDAIDGITRNFYLFNDLEKDFDWRKEKFKKAVAAQVEYFQEIGATTSYGMNEPSSVTIGRTSMSAGSQSASQNNSISKDAVTYLNGTGLLYRGLGVV